MHQNRPGQTSEVLLIVLYIGTTFLSFLPGLPAGRYRMGMVPFLMLFASFGGCSLFQLAFQRHYLQTALWTAFTVLVYALVSYPYVKYHPDAARWYYESGVAHSRSGHVDAAMDHYIRALNLDPELTAAHNNLGILYAQQRKYNQAEYHFGQIILHAAGYAKGYNNLGTVLAKQGRIEEAAQAYGKAVQIQPDYISALNNLGKALSRLGRTDEARKTFRRVLSVDPGNLTAASWLRNN